MNKKVIRKEINFAGRSLVLETGELAFMANNAVKASFGDTVLLATAVSGPANPEKDFFPLTVNYEEKLYASGSIKTSRFVKRDGRPTDEAVVTKRLIDHAIRPLFPSDYADEVQIIITVLSLDDACDPEFLAMIATSACLHSSDIPWEGPMTTVRVGYIGGEYITCPSKDELHTKSELDMMVSFVGTDRRFLAIEAEANILPEEKILGAIEHARNEAATLASFINDFAKQLNANGTKYVYASQKLSADLLKDVGSIAQAKIADMMRRNLDKTQMTLEQTTLFAEVATKFEGKYKKSDMQKAFAQLEKSALQNLILDEHKRPDGRGVKDIRPITTRVGLLPRTHGSALFTRGVTQVLTVATLGSANLELFIQNMCGEKTKRFIHYYNYPPYASGETGRLSGGSGSREIGHGMLAERALRPVVPTQKEFPYMVILVSETLSSSGSSSMAATCASTMALMDAGVPIKDMVAGVGVGLITNDDQTKNLIMTDLAYMEDAFGFLDFKMTGTANGVTAMQADMKAKGIAMNLLPKIVEQSKEGRLQVLAEMKKTIAEPNARVSQYAPKSFIINIDPEKIGMVIGTGGKVIKDIQAKTETEIAIEEDGTIIVSSVNEEGARRAVTIIQGLTKDVKPGEIYDGVVQDIVDFGAFVEVLPGKDGLLHVSELSHDYVNKVTDIVNVGDTVKVKVLEVSRDGKISLSKKALESIPEGHQDQRPQRSQQSHQRYQSHDRRHDSRSRHTRSNRY